MKGKNKKPVTGGQDADVVKAAQEIKAPSALQQKLDARAMDFLAWEDGTGKYAGKPKDFMDAPGYSNMLDIYGNAERIAQQDRIGDPTTAFAGAGRASNPFLQQVKEQNKMKIFDARASALSTGHQNLRNEAVTGAQYGAQADQGRRENYASAIGSYNDRFYNRPQRPNPWMQALGMAVGGAGALMSGGGSLAAGMGASGRR